MVLTESAGFRPQHGRRPEMKVERRRGNEIPLRGQFCAKAFPGVDRRPPDSGLPLTPMGDQLSIVDRRCKFMRVAEDAVMAQHSRKHVVGIYRELLETVDQNGLSGGHHRDGQMGEFVEPQQSFC